MLKGVGALIISTKTKRCLFGLRNDNTSYPLLWDMFGGKVRYYETISEGLTRELKEEIKVLSDVKQVIPFNVYTSNDKKFTYYSYIILVKSEFVPYLNNEHIGYAWVNVDKWNTIKLHPMVKKLLNNNNLLIKSINQLLEVK